MKVYLELESHKASLKARLAQKQATWMRNLPAGVDRVWPVPEGDGDTLPVPVGRRDVLLEAVMGDPEDDGTTPVLLAVPIVEFSMEVRVLVSVRVDDDCSSVHVVV